MVERGSLSHALLQSGAISSYESLRSSSSIDGQPEDNPEITLLGGEITAAEKPKVEVLVAASSLDNNDEDQNENEEASSSKHQSRSVTLRRKERTVGLVNNNDTMRESNGFNSDLVSLSNPFRVFW